MAEENGKKTETKAEQGAQPPLAIAGQYVKDLSLEVPGAPSIFTKLREKQPDITVNVDVTATRLENNTFEVVLSINVEANVGEDKAFLLELDYAGIFMINVAPEHLEPVLLIECPRMLFPFARNIVCDATRDGGFAPLMLQPMDFAALYRQRIEQSQAAKAAKEGKADA